MADPALAVATAENGASRVPRGSRNFFCAKNRERGEVSNGPYTIFVSHALYAVFWIGATQKNREGLKPPPHSISFQQRAL